MNGNPTRNRNFRKLTEGELERFLEQVYGPLAKLVLNDVYQSLYPDFQAAEDLASDAMTDFVEAVLDGKVKFETARDYVRRIAKNKLADHFKTHHSSNKNSGPNDAQDGKLREPDRAQVTLEEYISVEQCSPDEPLRKRFRKPGDEAEMRLFIQATDQALKSMSPEDREVILLRVMDELPAKEVARQLGIKVGAVNTRYLRAKRRLRELLKPWRDLD